jgi:hypothetical protein
LGRPLPASRHIPHRRRARCPAWVLAASCGLAFAPAVQSRAATTQSPTAADSSTTAAKSGGSTTAATSETRDPDGSYESLRGLESLPKEGSAGYPVARALLFVPRKLLDAITYSMAYGAYVGTESPVPRVLEEWLTFDQRRIGIHPLLSFSTGSTTAFGAEVAYRVPHFGASVTGLYGNRDNWGTRFDLVGEFTGWGVPFKLRSRAGIADRDDYEFFGFGPSPKEDPRNTFLAATGSDHVIFSQRLTRFSIGATARPWRDLQFFYSGFYQERGVSDFHDEHGITDFGGGLSATVNQTNRQVYQELGFRFDTRQSERRISPGIRLEGYAGIANGVQNDKGRFRRLGVDVAPYIPVLKRNRVLVPRFLLDTVDDLSEDQPLAFTDYPRQPSFRGASRTQLLRTDLFSAVPSVEYQWPLTHNVSGQIFLDYLMVADSMSHLTVRDAPYAYGAGIAIQGALSEIGRIAVSTGSEGVRLMIDFGLSTHVSDRLHWL